MRKIITLTSAFVIASSVCAMEPEQPQSPSIRGHEENRAVTFQDIQGLFGEFSMTQDDMAKKAIRANIINGLNSLLQRNKLANEDKEEATAIANALNAANLAVRISNKENFGDQLPPEIVQEIIRLALKGTRLQELRDGTNIPDLNKFLRVNPSFNKALLSTPVNLDLRKYTITDDALEIITQTFPNIINLKLVCKQISDRGLAHLNSLKNLEYLVLWNYGVNNKTLEPLAELRTLSGLYINGIKNNDLTPLTGLTNLTSLALNFNSNDYFYNRPMNLGPLANLTNLKSLDLSNSQAEDITALATLTNLTRLNLSNTQVRDITVLANLTNLTYLNLLHTKVWNVTPLEGLINLKVLSLGSDVDKNTAEELKKKLPNLLSHKSKAIK